MPRKPLWIAVGLLGLVVIGALACPVESMSSDDIEGTVVDTGTGRPVPFALVRAAWTGRTLNWAGSGSMVCYHAEETTADANGKYVIPRWNAGLSRQSISTAGRVIEVSAFSPGYVMPSRSPYDVHRAGLEPAPEAVAAHLERLQDYLRRGRCRGEMEKTEGSALLAAAGAETAKYQYARKRAVCVGCVPPSPVKRPDNEGHPCVVAASHGTDCAPGRQN
jgi:hypothetical protein